jgi:transketolase
MSNDPGPLSPVFSINVSADSGNANANAQQRPVDAGAALVALTRQMIEAQHRQNQVLDQLLQVSKQLLQNSTQANQQRQSELTQWRNAHPELVRSCRSALETLSSVQTDFLQKMADEVEASKDELSESEYMFSDFLDRYGPRMAHLNGVLQVLNHLCG